MASEALLDDASFRRWVALGLDALGTSREEIDSLNVYPVPDGDTGTNMFLTFEHAAPSADITLIAGQRYWFAASTVGLGGSGGYDVGGHSQNSGGIIDDGSFWYSNDAAGLDFDGQSQTPEMAFSVSISAVPEPAPVLLLGVGLLALGLAARRRASAPASLGQRIRSGSHP